MKLDTLKTRITPADAGKTNINGVIELDEEDHPRRCGENICTEFYQSYR